MSKPVSILDRDAERPIIIEPDDSSSVLLPLITLLFTIVFLGYVLYILISSNWATTTENNRVSTDVRTQQLFSCPIGSCPTSLTTGFKVCNSDNTGLTPYDPSIQVCNNRFLCDNPVTPFALQSDGSTNIYGVCEPNVECPCLLKAQCPQYILSYFSSNNGNAYQSVAGQRILFPQITSSINPIILTNSSTQFCAVPLSWLPLSNPGCNFVGSPTGTSMTYQDLLVCMGSLSGCNGVTASPCLQGILAIISNDPDSLTQNNINNAQLGCVSGNNICGCDEVSIYDVNFGGIICKKLV